MSLDGLRHSLHFVPAPLFRKSTKIVKSYKLAKIHYDTKAFHLTLVHGLLEDDYDRQLEFCENWLQKLDDHPELEDSVLWSHKSTFQLDGHYYIQLCYNMCANYIQKFRKAYYATLDT
uniref:Uncharacterized protein n=1 Tax=Romanomermis culicivorax TaxID=13658 RepID=A0A915IPH1_ROMCU